MALKTIEIKVCDLCGVDDTVVGKENIFSSRLIFDHRGTQDLSDIPSPGIQFTAEPHGFHVKHMCSNCLAKAVEALRCELVLRKGTDAIREAFKGGVFNNENSN